MKIRHVLVLLPLTLLLGASLIVAQFVYRAETTVRSYRYMSERLEGVLEPLREEDTHRETITEAVKYIRRRMSLRVPAELDPFITEAALDAFSRQWVTRTANQMLYSLMQVLNGREQELNLPLSIGGFKNSFLALARPQFEPQEAAAIAREVDRVPSTIDLADDIPDDVLKTLRWIGANVPIFSFLLQYVLPGILIILCFSLRRIGSGLIAIGSGCIVGGIGGFLLSRTYAGASGTPIINSALSGLPRFLGWAREGIAETARDIVSGIAPMGLIILGVGVVLAAVGVLLVANGKDTIQSFSQ